MERRPPSRLFILLTAAVPVTAAVHACATWVQEPEVRSVQVGLAEVGLAGGTLRVVLQVYNPNGFGVDARAFDYELAFLPAGWVADTPDGTPPDDAWRRLATGATRDEIRLPARDSTHVTVDVPFEYRDVGDALSGLLREGRLRYRFSGAFTVGTPVGDRRIPFDQTGLLRP
jgi:LEA14-like dessication related protein